MSDPSNISSQIMTTLGVGSGMDVFKLAQDLTDVEKIPKQEAIESEITATEASISGYALVSYQIGLLQSAFEQLNDVSELKSSSAASANDALVSFTSVDGSVTAGGYDLEVSQLAQEQRSISDQYSSTSASLNGSAFDLSITVGNTSTTTSTVTVSTPTPEGVVAAINASSTGIKATLIDTGTSGANYRIVLSGPSGSEGAFSISSTPDLGFSDGGNTLQSAQDGRGVALFSVRLTPESRRLDLISASIKGMPSLRFRGASSKIEQPASKQHPVGARRRRSSVARVDYQSTRSRVASTALGFDAYEDALVYAPQQLSGAIETTVANSNP